MKFDTIERLSLSYLGKLWKENDCFLEFESLTWEDMEGGLFDIGSVNPDDPKSVSTGMKTSSEILTGRFIKGKGISEGKVVDITKENFGKLPAGVVMKALAFLSQSLATESDKLSETSSEQKAQ